MTETVTREVHWFDNGVGVYDDHLTEGQRERYQDCNLHEPEEEQIFLEQIKSLPQNAVYLNIGCAIGYYMFLAYQHRPDLQIYGVEPLAEHQQFCQDNQIINQIPPEAITLFPLAVSDETGTARFQKKDYGSVLLPRDEPTHASSIMCRLLQWWKTGLFGKVLLSSQAEKPPLNVTSVQTRTLDELVAQLGGSVDLLQMDIQGLEAAALRGGAESLDSKSISRLLIGTHSEKLHQECKILLKSSGYRITFSEHSVAGQPDGIVLAF